jgi:hypothetical protein
MHEQGRLLFEPGRVNLGALLEVYPLARRMGRLKALERLVAATTGLNAAEFARLVRARRKPALRLIHGRLGDRSPVP